MAKKFANSGAGRKVIFSEVTTEIRGESNPITSEEAKKLLGWEEITADDKREPLFEHKRGKEMVRVFTANNTKNRPFSYGSAETYAQEILNGRWKLNGETVVIGETGSVLSGQHRLVAAVLAGWMLEDDPKTWKAVCKGVPGLPTIITYGVSESGEVTKTLDNGRTRTLSDVLYTDTSLFSRESSKSRKDLSKMLETALKFVYFRATADRSAFNPHTTNGAYLEWHSRHKGLTESVKKVWGEADTKLIGEYLSAGYLSGVHYLLSVSATDEEVYFGRTVPSEKYVSWNNHARADEYIADIAANAKTVSAMREYITGTLTDAETGRTASRLERIAVILKGWEQYLKGKNVTPKGVELSFEVDETTGAMKIVDHPTAGGIDRGENWCDDPTEEEIQAEAQRIKQEGLDRKRDSADSEDEVDTVILESDEAPVEVIDTTESTTEEPKKKTKKPKKPELKGGIG